MYKIRPPKNEVRWVEGALIVPADGSARRQQDLDPFNEGERFEKTPGRSKRKYEDNSFDDDSSQTWGKDVDDDHHHDADHHQRKHDHRGDPPEPEDYKHSKHSDGFGKKPLVRTKNGVAVRRNYPEQEQLEAERERLEALDDRFRAIISRDAAAWDFRELEHDYRRLQDEVSVPALASQIQLRFGAIDHYRELKGEYREYVQLASETSRRDAELLSVQRVADPNPGGLVYHAAKPEFHPPAPQFGTAEQQFPDAGRPPYPPAGPVSAEGYPSPAGPALAAPEPADESYGPGPSLGGPVPAPGPAVAQPTFVSPEGVSATSPIESQQAPFNGSVPYPENVQPSMPGASPSGSYLPQPEPRRTNQFDGAGIIQRAVGSPPGAPQHVLLTPSGRVLAYLQGAPGVNLDAYIGRPMGLFGQRSHRPDLRGDLLVVNNAVPVRLKQQ